MPVTLTITDNGDQTGTATIAGGNVAATNTLYYATFTGTGSYSWASFGSKVGDGTIAITALTGYYLWQVESVLAGATTVSQVAYQSILPSSTDTLHLRILEAVVARLQQLTLTGMAPVRVSKKWYPRFLRNVEAIPFCQVCPVGDEEDHSQTTNQEDYAYPVVVVLGSAQDGDGVANMGRNLKWRNQIKRALAGQRLTGLTEVWDYKMKKSPVIADLEQYQKGIWVSVLAFEFTSRESRGLTT